MRKFLIVLVLVLLALFFRLRPRPAAISPARKLKPDLEIEASKLLIKFLEDEAAANELFLNKIIVVKGKVREFISNVRGFDVVKLETNHPNHYIHCRMDKKEVVQQRYFKSGSYVRLKCVCAGYTDRVEMVQCVE